LPFPYDCTATDEQGTESLAVSTNFKFDVGFRDIERRVDSDVRCLPDLLARLDLLLHLDTSFVY
jgi:hypothetical protein